MKDDKKILLHIKCKYVRYLLPICFSEQENCSPYTMEKLSWQSLSSKLQSDGVRKAKWPTIELDQIVEFQTMVEDPDMPGLNWIFYWEGTAKEQPSAYHYNMYKNEYVKGY